MHVFFLVNNVKLKTIFFFLNYCWVYSKINRNIFFFYVEASQIFKCRTVANITIFSPILCGKNWDLAASQTVCVFIYLFYYCFANTITIFHNNGRNINLNTFFIPLFRKTLYAFHCCGGWEKKLIIADTIRMRFYDGFSDWTNFQLITI